MEFYEFCPEDAMNICIENVSLQTCLFTKYIDIFFLVYLLYAFSFKQHFNKQRQVEIGKKIKQTLSNTLKLNFCYMKIFTFFPCYHPKMIGGILKNAQKTASV